MLITWSYHQKVSTVHFQRSLSPYETFYLCTDSALLCCVLVIGLTCRLKAPPCPEHCTAGTAASTTTGTTRPRLKPARCIWLTAARGRTATPPAPPSEISSQGRRWMSFSSSCTWVLMCRKWPSSRAWTPASYWACSAVAAKGTQTYTHYLKGKLSRVGWLAGLSGQSPTPDTSNYPVSFTTHSTYNEFPLTSCLLYSKPQSVQGHRLCPTIPFFTSGDKYYGKYATMTRHNSLLLSILNYILPRKRKYHECNPVLRMLTDVLLLCLSFHIDLNLVIATMT